MMTRQMTPPHLAQIVYAMARAYYLTLGPDGIYKTDIGGWEGLIPNRQLTVLDGVALIIGGQIQHPEQCLPAWLSGTWGSTEDRLITNAMGFSLVKAAGPWAFK